MRTAGLPNFRKLWGRIEGGLQKGSYQILIDNQYVVEPYQGKKYFALSTSNSLGGKNTVSGVIYIVIGILSLIASLILLIEWLVKAKTD